MDIIVLGVEICFYDLKFRCGLFMLLMCGGVRCLGSEHPTKMYIN